MNLNNDGIALSGARHSRVGSVKTPELVKSCPEYKVEYSVKKARIKLWLKYIYVYRFLLQYFYPEFSTTVEE